MSSDIKKQILQILVEFSSQERSCSPQRSIVDSDFDELSDALIDDLNKDKQGGTMKPTEQDAIDASQEYLDKLSIVSGNEFKSVPLAFRYGAQWAVSQMQQEWVAVEPRTPELTKRLESTDGRLIQCLFDTGEILAFNDEPPFAIMTHYCFLPQPPTK